MDGTLAVTSTQGLSGPGSNESEGYFTLSRFLELEPHLPIPGHPSFGGLILPQVLPSVYSKSHGEESDLYSSFRSGA